MIRRFERYNDEGRRCGPRAHRELRATLFDLERHVCHHEVITPNYHRGQQAGPRASTTLTDSAENSVVDQRMNKRRQMRRSEAGARSRLRVRTATSNGEPEQLNRAAAHGAANEPIVPPLAA